MPSIVFVYVLGGIRASFSPFVRARLSLFSEMRARARVCKCVCVCDPWPRQNLAGRIFVYIYIYMCTQTVNQNWPVYTR
jgi:hypothetical protein